LGFGLGGPIAAQRSAVTVGERLVDARLATPPIGPRHERAVIAAYGSGTQQVPVDQHRAVDGGHDVAGVQVDLTQHPRFVEPGLPAVALDRRVDPEG